MEFLGILPFDVCELIEGYVIYNCKKENSLSFQRSLRDIRNQRIEAEKRRTVIICSPKCIYQHFSYKNISRHRNECEKFRLFDYAITLHNMNQRKKNYKEYIRVGWVDESKKLLQDIKDAQLKLCGINMDNQTKQRVNSLNENNLRFLFRPCERDVKIFRKVRYLYDLSSLSDDEDELSSDDEYYLYNQ